VRLSKTCIHEAGHAVAACLLGHPIIKVARDGMDSLRKRHSKAARLREIVIALAGPCAEQTFFPLPIEKRRTVWCQHWHSDQGNIRKHLATLPAHIRRAMRKALTREAVNLVRSNRRAVLTCALALEKYGTLTGNDVARIVQRSEVLKRDLTLRKVVPYKQAKPYRWEDTASMGRSGAPDGHMREDTEDYFDPRAGVQGRSQGPLGSMREPGQRPPLNLGDDVMPGSRLRTRGRRRVV
jgi:hypothetical protein